MGFIIDCNYKVIYRWSHLLASTIKVDIDGFFFYGYYYKRFY